MLGGTARKSDYFLSKLALLGLLTGPSSAPGRAQIRKGGR
jgi:hypothetical protein